MARTGLDILISDAFKPISNKRIGLVCNQATIASDYRHILEHLLPLHQKGLEIGAIFGPQHGLWGHTQDNMIEWEGGMGFAEIPTYSLYGEHREPTQEMLRGLDLLVIDLPDIGSRYYTFIWTTVLCIKAASEAALPILILDRPNPIGGTQVEGTVLDPEFSSFVGLFPLPTRHGMTLGEIARYVAERYFPEAQVEINVAANWRREQYADDANLPWAMPSPNMPTLDTALVYPGACLVEGTNVSEGRGTTRPFEIVGAPWIDAWRFADRMNELSLPGVRFRPIQFQPTFQKHAGTICEGVFVHVLDRLSFKPVLTYVALLQDIIRSSSNDFAWKSPPYEYEFNKLPIDILAGNAWLRQAIEESSPLPQIEERFRSEVEAFAPYREANLLY